MSLSSAQTQSLAAGSTNPIQSEAGRPPDPSSAAPTLEGSSSDQIDADVRKLHLLAAELREEVGKTYKASLSVDVLKKAKEIEVLSKSLKERMDQKAAAARHR